MHWQGIQQVGAELNCPENGANTLGSRVFFRMYHVSSILLLPMDAEKLDASILLASMSRDTHGACIWLAPRDGPKYCASI